jgi:hypothetical protein
MIKFSEAKVGDFVMAEFEGKQWMGEVIRLNKDEKQVCVLTDVQEFWFSADKLHAIPLNDEALQMLSFTKQTSSDDGSVKYSKGAFRLVIAKEGDFSHIDMWYREDKRHNPNVHYVHELQNHYYQMTKIHLTKELV